MKRRIYVLLPLILLCSCSVWKPAQPTDEVADVRLDIKRCPVHDEPLIEAVNSVDWERGSMIPTYYKIREELFPCSFDDPYSLGDLARVTYCRKCRAANAKYRRDQHSVDLFDLDAIDDFIARQRRELNAEYVGKP